MISRFTRYIAASFVFLGLLTLETPASATNYMLGPKDKLRIRVYDWRPGSGEVHEWTALNGEFMVGASGTVSFPLVGDLQAAGVTTSVLSQKLSQALQAKVGLASAPYSSVEVLEYRPIYVLGYVEKAGEYAYRPDMTVLQAVGIAGGLPRLTDGSLLGFERDALTSRGEVRMLRAERSGLLGRQARLEAEIAGTPTIDFPAELTANASDPDNARLMREEELLLASSRQTILDQTNLINQTRSILDHEIETLDEKDVSLGRQLDLSKQELGQVTDLVSKGLAVKPRQLALEQSAAQFEASRLDVQLTKLRAKQDLSRASRDIVELETKRRTDALTESSDVRSRIAVLNERISTAETLIYQAEVRAPEVTAAESDRSRMAPLYKVTRTEGQAVQTSVVTQGDLLEPGDVLEVEQPRSGPTISAN